MLFSQDIKTWLETASDGVVYFSLGSLLQAETLPRHMMQALLGGFEAVAPLRVLWKFGADQQKLPYKLPSNVKTAMWLPQMEVLSKSDTGSTPQTQFLFYRNWNVHCLGCWGVSSRTHITQF